MAILTVAGVTVKVAPDGARRQLREIGGDRAEMFDGSMRSTVRGYKSTWQITTKLLIQSDYAALAAVLATGAPVSVTGDLLFGASVPFLVQLTDVTPQWTKGQLRYRVSFTLYER